VRRSRVGRAVHAVGQHGAGQREVVVPRVERSDADLRRASRDLLHRRRCSGCGLATSGPAREVDLHPVVVLGTLVGTTATKSSRGPGSSHSRSARRCEHAGGTPRSRSCSRSSPLGDRQRGVPGPWNSNTLFLPRCPETPRSSRMIPRLHPGALELALQKTSTISGTRSRRVAAEHDRNVEAAGADRDHPRHPAWVVWESPRPSSGPACHALHVDVVADPLPAGEVQPYFFVSA